METQTETELTVGSLGNKPKRSAIPAASYEAAYTGLRVFMDNTPWGMKKVVKLAFKIAGGPHDGVNVYYKGSMFKLDSGDYVIGDKSELAARIMAITGGGKTLNESHKNIKVIVGVKNQTSKKTGDVYDFVDTVLRMPDSVQTVHPSVQQPAAKPAVTSQTAHGTPPAATVAKPVNDNLMDDLADLSDFEDAAK